MPRIYDLTRPWREQLDENAIEEMIRTYAPQALERLGFERLLTPKRMFDEYKQGNLTREELIPLYAHYDGLVTPRTPLGEDPEPSPDEGCRSRDLRMADLDADIHDTLIDAAVQVAEARREQLDENAIEEMIHTHAPQTLERLGLERLLTPKRMMDEYVSLNLTREELIVLFNHYNDLITPKTATNTRTSR